MHFDICSICGVRAIIFDLDLTAEGKLRCNDQEACQGRWLDKPDVAPVIPLHAEKRKLTRPIDDIPLSSQPDSLAAEFGFTKPEDGSESRYVKRKTYVKRVPHTFWWLVHNNIAHALIGILPVRVTFKFHDWTSHKLHGR